MNLILRKFEGLSARVTESGNEKTALDGAALLLNLPVYQQSSVVLRSHSVRCAVYWFHSIVLSLR
jgi:hypothetical protein